MSNNQKRSFKFYRENEREVMEALGLKPTKNSGSGWIEKEDGQNDAVICQLKSTDAQSIKVNQKDIRILEKNSLVEHKIPMFAIQFLNTGEVWLMVKPEHIKQIGQYLDTGEKPVELDLGIELGQQLENDKPIRTIKSSSSSRERFHNQQKSKYNKTRSAT